VREDGVKENKRGKDSKEKEKRRQGKGIANKVHETKHFCRWQTSS
jgi:hypothetical protein